MCVKYFLSYKCYNTPIHKGVITYHQIDSIEFMNSKTHIRKKRSIDKEIMFFSERIMAIFQTVIKLNIIVNVTLTSVNNNKTCVSVRNK